MNETLYICEYYSIDCDAKRPTCNHKKPHKKIFDCRKAYCGFRDKVLGCIVYELWEENHKEDVLLKKITNHEILNEDFDDLLKEL